MTLRDLLTKLPKARIAGSPDTVISAICCDSRKVGEGTLFAALRGVEADGHEFIPSAIEKGAAAVLAETAATGNTPWVQVDDARAALSAMADVFYDRPSLKMKVAGVTGTNGKTTTAFLLHHIFTTAFHRSGLIGTVHYEIAGRIEPATHTTPESIELQRILGEMVDEGCRAAAMEVSSHALLQSRVDDVEFDGVIFTNLTRDHLDYHGDIDSYYDAKKKLFGLASRQMEKSSASLVINTDDSYGAKLAREFEDTGQVATFGMNLKADYRVTDFQFTSAGTQFTLNVKGRSLRVRLPLIGRFNIYNALGALAAADSMGVQLRQAVTCLADVPQVPGRMESVGEGTPYRVFVDYAHTPDALTNALQTLRELSPRRLICVFGCGGNRDVPKRALMGAAAGELADFAIITSDNPRKEDPMAIIQDIEKGIRRGAYKVVEDREEAIREAVTMTTFKDIVLIAGKGHEAEQKFADRTIPFDDRRVAKFAINDRRREESEQ